MQTDIKIEATQNRPAVSFSATTGKLLISGRSIVENAIRYYDPLVEWIIQYCQNPAIKTEFHLKLEYFNTSTSKYLLSIIEHLQELYNEGKDVEIYWYSVDEDMEELGEDFNAMVDIPFKFLEYSI